MELSTVARRRLVVRHDVVKILLLLVCRSVTANIETSVESRLGAFGFEIRACGFEIRACGFEIRGHVISILRKFRD
jgi:hypothetical protein